MPFDTRNGMLEVTISGRKAHRRRLRLTSKGTTAAGGATEVLIYDLSATGLLLETSAEIPLGEIITVEVPLAGKIPATVVWKGGNLFGCRFHKPISTAALSAAQLQSPIEPDAPAREEGPANSSDDVHARIVRLRHDAGLTMSEFAERMNVSKTTVWNWETGRSRPRRGNLDAIAEALGVTRAQLLAGRTAPSIEVSGEGASDDLAQVHVSSEARHFDQAVPQTTRLSQLVQASKEQLALQAGTTADKVKIVIEF